MVRKPIRKKVLAMMLSVSLLAIFLIILLQIFFLKDMNRGMQKSYGHLTESAAENSKNALHEQIKTRLLTLSEDRASVAETNLQMILNQTQSVAMAAEEIYKNRDRYLDGKSSSDLPLDLYTLSCSMSADLLGKYSIHLRSPRDFFDPDSIEEANGVVTKAEFDPDLLSDRQREDLYLAFYLDNVIGGIQNFDNGDGTYNGIGASYFCMASSGIDLLADTLTTPMVEYDARNSTWYVEASKLSPGEVYWTDPVMDGSGRGISLICAIPVYVDGELIGVAGSGGLIDNIREMVQGTTIGEGGYSLLLNIGRSDQVVNVIATSDTDSSTMINRYSMDLLQCPNQSITEILEEIQKGEDTGIQELVLDEENSYFAYAKINLTDWVWCTVIPSSDSLLTTPISQLNSSIDKIIQRSFEGMHSSIILISICLGVAALGLIILIFFLSFRFSAALTKPIYTLMEGVKTISDGNLDYRIEVKSNDEIALLGDSFNQMTSSLKDYIQNLASVTAERERIGAELNVATNIQASMLPCIFPPFPDREEFDIYASMQPAKEVGGDFYDFFMVDDQHLAVVVADVSGKGVPAALFMAIGKTLIKDHTDPGVDLGDVFTKVNEILCSSNSEELFITAFEGVLDRVTGGFRFVNAGHEIPFLALNGEPFQSYKTRAGFVLAGMEGIRYRSGSMMLKPGDKLFEYTDGVTEATNAENELYGMERLESILGQNTNKSPEELLNAVKADVDAFVGTAPQFDDITMLCLSYKKALPMSDKGAEDAASAIADPQADAKN